MNVFKLFVQASCISVQNRERIFLRVIQFYSYVIKAEIFSLFFGYWIEEIDIWNGRIIYTKEILRSKKVTT